MADYFQVKNQNIFNPPANTSLGNATNQFNDVYVQNDLVLGNVTVTGTTIIAPRITTITYPGDDTAADTAGGQTITLTGTGFVAGANLLINGSAVGVVSVVSSTTITFVSPANTTGSYVIYVINPDGSTAIAIPGIQYSGTPAWTTAAGTLGNVYETASFTQTVTATGDAPITYSVASGSIPPGSTFNANGTITGTSQLSSSPTTYSFTVRATDAQLQDTDRAFSISVIPDVVTWSSPANNTTYTQAANVAIANITLSATSAVGSGITYSANSLPTGLSLTGANISGTPTVSANTSTLLTATANTTSELSSITINWSVSVASDPYFMYNTLLLPGTGSNGAQNNTFLDGSTNNFAITRNGNTTQGTFSPYGPNWSNYFDGTGDYLSLTGSGLGSGNFTIELWGYFTSFPNAQNALYNNGAADGITSCILYLTSSGSLSLYNYTSAVGTSTTNVSLNTWTHIAVVRVGSTLTYYINGVASGTGTTTANISETSVKVMQGFGGISASPIGYISNLRTVVGTAVYTANFTPSTTPLTAISGTSLLTCQSNRFKDNSTNNFAITRNGDVSVQRFSPFSPGSAYSTSVIGGSGYFDGTGDYLSIATNSALTLSGDYTVEAWVYVPSGGITSPLRVFLNNPGTVPTGYWFLFVNAAQLNFQMYNADVGVLPNVGAYVLNSWNHFAASRSGATTKVFVNGTQTYSYAGSTTFTNNGWYVGGGPDVEFFKGYIANHRVVVGTAVYTTNFTPPTAPVTAITNTRLLTNFTNAGIIDNTMISNLETIGNAQISTAQTKFGGGSMYFDGVGDYLSIPNNIWMNLGTTFTIEFWLYRTANSAMRVVSRQDGSPPYYGYSISYGEVANTWYFDASGVSISFADGGLINQWVHWAWVVNGTAGTVYRNGVSVGTATQTAQTPSTNTALLIGTREGSASVFLVGYLDDLRITKGYARYTTTFTPPTSAFPTY